MSLTTISLTKDGGGTMEPLSTHWSKRSDHFYGLMRIITGFLFACHGAQKLFGVLGASSELHDPEGLAAGIIEFRGGILICVGFFTGVAAFVASGEMAVAYFKAHAPRGFWPVLNRGELAALYAFVFLYISARGSGIWSLDALRIKLARRRTDGTKSVGPSMPGRNTTTPEADPTRRLAVR